jgi:hypothetical protein
MMPAVVAMHYLHDAPTLAAFSSAATPPASTATRHRESTPEHRNQTEPSTLPDKSTIPFLFLLILLVLTVEIFEYPLFT